MNNMKIKIVGIMYLISGYLFALITILMNPINIFIDILVLFGFFLITIGFLIMFLEINKPIINNKDSNTRKLKSN